MNVCLCPDQTQLREYACGEFDSEEIERHLESCSGCRQTLHTLEGEATSLASWLQPVALDVTVDEPLLAKLTARAKGLLLGGTIATRRKPCTSSELLRRLEQSGLLTRQEFNSVPAQETETDGEDLAKLLVQRKTLTRYQADELLEDRGAGLVLGDYVILDLIARGGMGAVFKGWHRGMKRTVAIKTVAPALTDQEEAAARFQREVEAIARLSHPHIVAAHDAFESRENRFLVMEHVEGKGLDQLVRERGPLPVAQAIDFIKQAALGLAHAHAAGIIHRDVKPANLLVDGSNTVKVLDLGLARLSLPDAPPPVSDLTGGSVVMGTAAYMAPEQGLDPRSAGAAADVYALGCTLHFLLTGRPPYRGDSVLATLLAHRDEPIPSLAAGCPACPPALDSLWRRMLAKRPKDRPSSMNAVVTELERVQSGTHTGPVRGRVLLRAALLAAVLLLALLLPHTLPTAAGPQAVTALKSAPVPSAKKPAIEMARIEAGKFFMGSHDSDREALPDEKPRHEVKITRPFLLGKFEITQEQYEEVMGVNPSAFSAKGRQRNKVKDVDTKQHPVESISWNDAVAFCNRLSEKHGLEPYYRIEGKQVTVKGGTGFRLPTEAEWEYAARAGSEGRWSHGNDIKEHNEHAWHAGNSDDHTHPVGQKKPNAWGLFDMHGNVAEWCWDRYSAEYYQQSNVHDPAGPGSGDTRVFRGGGWNTPAMQTRSAARNNLGMAYTVLTPVGIGLRVARDIGE
jgi:formylglycine-generating enzyme required for sulfatase activity